MTLDEFEVQVKYRADVQRVMADAGLSPEEFCLAKVSKQNIEITLKLIELAKAAKYECGRMRCLGYPNPKFEALVEKLL